MTIGVPTRRGLASAKKWGGHGRPYAAAPAPTDGNAHALSCTNFAGILGAGQLVAMVVRGWAWLTVRILSCTL